MNVRRFVSRMYDEMRSGLCGLEERGQLTECPQTHVLMVGVGLLVCGGDLLASVLTSAPASYFCFSSSLPALQCF